LEEFPVFPVFPAVVFEPPDRSDFAMQLRRDFPHFPHFPLAICQSPVHAT
jgi:hypothetical protein